MQKEFKINAKKLESSDFNLTLIIQYLLISSCPQNKLLSCLIIKALQIY